MLPEIVKAELHRIRNLYSEPQLKLLLINYILNVFNIIYFSEILENFSNKISSICTISWGAYHLIGNIKCSSVASAESTFFMWYTTQSFTLQKITADGTVHERNNSNNVHPLF